MKLKNLTTQAVLTLSDELLWTDEFEWTPVKTNSSYSMTGALIVEQGVMQAGRPISLEQPDETMGKLKRAIALTLAQWAAIKGQTFELTLERGGNRTYIVMFNTDKPMTAKPSKGFVGLNSPDDWYNVNLYFIEVV